MEGFVYGAFLDNRLKGFVSVESELFGDENKYLDLSGMHISEDMCNKGIGIVLFLAARDRAWQHEVNKLYISAHFAVESQVFYKKMGCVEAELYNKEYVQKEPYNCQLECKLQ